MKYLLAGIFIIFAEGYALAQTISVDLSKANFNWTWTQGTGGPATEFHVKCGSATNTYTRVTTVAPTARSLPVKDGITGSGNWYCAVSAVNQYGESANSNEVFFSAGAGPSAPTNFGVSAQ